MSYRRPLWLPLAVALVLSACGGGGSDAGPGNSAPVAANDSATTMEDQPVTIAVLANDTDADGQDDIDPASVTVGAAVHGTGAVDTGTGAVTFTPEANYTGAAGFGYTVSDRSGARSQPAQVSITVQGANDAPTISNIADREVPEGTSTGAIAFQVADAETPAAQLTVTGNSSNTALVPPGGIAFGGGGPNRTVTVTPAAGQSGTTTITVRVSDGTASASDSFVLTVVASNDKPVAQPASVVTDEDTPADGTLAATDADGDALTFRAATQPAHGTATVAADGAFTYAPAANFAGDDSFTFVASDGAADSDPATVSISVVAQPEPQLSVADASADEDAGALEFRVALSRAPDAPVTVHYATADATATAGSDYTAASGDLQFTPDGALEQAVTVPVTDDASHENDESLKLVLTVTAGADSVEAADLEASGAITDNDAENTTLLRIGAAKRNITPAQAHIDGVEEPRAFGAGSHVQKFNLGGFGINPLSNTPDDPAGIVQMANGELTKPAGSPLFTNSAGRPEHTQVRALAIEQPGGATVVFVMIDAVGAGNLIQKGVKDAVIAAAAGLGVTLQPQDILFGQTHSHAGADLQGLWGGVPQDWIANTLYPAAAAAVADALAARRPAHLSLKQGHTTEFNSYRRPKIDPGADADGTITLLQATAEDGTAIGNILQYNAHPTGIGDGTDPRRPHPDYILGAMEWLESTATGPGGVSLYYNGPIADASGSGGRAGCAPVAADQPFSGVRCKGEGIADYLLHDANVEASRELAPTVAAQSVEVFLPVTNPGFLAFGLTGSFNRYYNFMDVATDQIPGIDPYLADLPQLTPVARTYVSRVTIGGADGGLEIVTIPGEATNTFGDYIRGLAKTNVMLLGLTHNSFGYILPEEEFSYVDQEGDDGLVAPFTGYEENVSLGPLTAPMLRTQAYNVLFGAAPEKNVPPTLSSCVARPESATCALTVIDNRVSALLNGIEACVEGGLQADGCPLRTTLNLFADEFAGYCRDFGGPEEFCNIFRTGAGDIATLDADVHMAALAADTVAKGCDFLDPSYCLFPFPNDHFTVAAAPNSPQSVEQGGTGRRVNLNIAGMPRNSAGKPVDPTEWNRNDGFSPGQMIVTYVPGLKVEANGSVGGAVPIMDVAQSLDADAPIFVIDADTGERHLVWAEIDLNAGLLAWQAVPEVVESEGQAVERPTGPGRAALIIRPAKNFEEGHRYIVALRNLKGEHDRPLTPSLGFQVCRGDVPSSLRDQPPVAERCDHVQELIGTLQQYEDDFSASELYLAWDFTVASAKNNVGRLAHMRDVAFNSLATAPGTDCTQHADGVPCAAPQFTIEQVTDNPQDGIARRIEGTITVPSFVVPVEPTPADNAQVNAVVSAFCANAPEGDFRSGCADVTGIGGGATLPPNRLFYSPADGDPAAAAADPSQSPYGDGLPDTVGPMQTRFICQIPQKALSEGPARAGIYGHGLLDSRVAVTYDGVPQLSREYNFMFCAVDLFGFATGDLGNVASTLVDVSNFPVVPDGSQQGLLNYMFLARLIAHPQGFAADPAFQQAGAPLFDRREVFYDGNSQGGIVGGAVLAISKDVNRGVLGSLGMNYSTLLQRSKDFDPYSSALYAAYPDTLDRMFLFSFMQMLWDRSENNGYAEHLTRKSEVEGGPVDAVLLNPMYGDQQVTMWSADVMARTMGIPVDYAMVGRAGKHHPDTSPGWPLPPLGYDLVEGNARYSNAPSALINWADVRTDDNIPTGNVAHRAGRDPHDDSAKKAAGRCAKAHFLHRNGRFIDINTELFQPELEDHGVACPAQPDNSGAPGATPTAALDAFARLIALIDSILAPAQQALADAMVAIAQQAGELAGLWQDPPPAVAVDNPAPQPLLAGAAKRPIQVPVGTPLGGYLRPPVGGEYIGDDPAGEIADNAPSANDGCDPTAPDSCFPNAPLPDEARKAHSPYATYSPPSRGYYDSLIAKAVALYDGHDYVVMVKTDMIGMLDEVVQDVKADVKARKGIDLGNGLIMSATHSHDGPGALANNSTRYFWLAMDAYQHDVYRRLIGQLADVVIAALDDLKPARIGHGNGLESPQTVNGNGINGYRRGRFESYKDNDRPGCEYVDAAQCPAGITDADELRKRIGVLRVDDAATGAPIAVVVNFADHGIAFDVENQYFSGDVLASIEREVEQSFVKPDGGAAFRAPIAMLVQNTGGDVTPKNVPYSIRGIEMLGKRMAPEVRAVVDAIDEFQQAPDLRTVSQRIVLNRERLGYAEGEYPYAWGAAQCGNDIAVPFADVGVNDIPGYGDTGLPTKHLYCIPAAPPDADDLADNGVAENGAFVPQDTILSAAKIGDITLIVQPGEPLTEYGVRSLEMAQAEGYALPDTFVWGYSADHVGYILPPVKEDWATFGGAESTTTFWGWKQGERFIDGHRELLRALRDGTAAPADEFQLDYSLGKQMVENTPAAQPTPSLLPGAVVAQPADIARFGKTAFTWEGGDPVVDFPAVVMQHADGTPARRANGEVIDTFFEMHIKYRLVSGRHLWTVEFEAPKDWAAGGYRFAVSGKASQGGTVEYALESATFAVAVATNLQATGMACAAGTCSVHVDYTPVPSNYRIVDASVDPNNAAPMRTGAVTFTDGTDTVVVPADGSGNFSAAIAGAVTATAVDAWGNIAPAVTAGGTPPADADGDGVPDASDQCPAEAGPASNNGCPEQQSAGFPVPLCEPVAGYCLSDIPGIGEPLQDAIDTAWATLNGGGGGGEPPPVAPPDTGDVEQVAGDAAHNAATLPADLQASAAQTADNAANGTLADRRAEAVVLEGKSVPDWSQPAAFGLANPYPSGVGGDGEVVTGDTPFYVRDAHNGTMLYPPAGVPFEGLPTAAPVGEIVAFRRQDDRWVEIPVQVDERFPYFLANAHSGFSFYSGTDMELTYAWDRETWKAAGECAVDEDSVAPMADPVPGLDDDDEIAFMAGDAGDPAAATAPAPEGTVGAGQEVALSDPLNPGVPKFVYLYRRPGGSSFARGHYVSYQRDANADQWVDRGFWADSDPEKLGTSNTGYGPNLSGTVCPDGTPRPSTDRFPRDGVTVSTDNYKVYASGRWMVRNVQIAKPGTEGQGIYGADIVDRWKGRAFQQSPDSTISLVGFEDEQVNWEANSSLLGERAGPVRAIREIWGADSGTNVTKTETYYRDAYAFRYRVRVHPIPPDGLYTSWDYNRGAMVPAPGENVPGGRYFTAVRGTGVPIDGINDDVGQVDRVQPVGGQCLTSDGPQPAEKYGGVCPLFFDSGDPALNLPLTMYNWEQVAAKGDLGSLVYLFELKGPTIGANSVAMPYYRDDACLDDGTGDDPVQRPWPGEDYRWNGGAVPKAYDQRAGRALDHSGNTFADCLARQGAHAQHGIHFFAPPESDNATMPVPVDEIDGQQWAFAVPMAAPTNVGERYANVVRVPLQKVVRPRPAVADVAGDGTVPYDYASCVAMAQQGEDAQQEAAAKFTCAVIFGGGRTEGEGASDEIQGPNTYVAMDDGTLIATNVYIPWACNVARNPAARKCPAILEMSGYESGSDEGQTPSGDMDDILGNPGLPLTGGTRAAHDRYYKAGDRYVSVVASVRGTGCSAGEFDVFSRKSAYDGYQLVEWMAQQPWANGKVGVFGHSYSGITGAMIASTAPPHLAMVSVSGQIGDIYRDIVYPGGVSNYGFPLLWTGGVRPAYDYLGGTFAGLISDSQDRQCLRNQAERSRTVEDEPLVQGLSDVDGPWFQARSVVNVLKNVKAPTQIVTAYQDEQTGPRGGTNVFDALPQNLTRRLVMLNGDHGTQTGPAEVLAERRFWIDRFMLGPDDPPPRAWNPGNDLPAPVIAADGTATSRVLLEVTADKGTRSNGHVDSTGFPLAQTQWTDFYFHGADGTLDRAPDSTHDGEAGSSSTWFNGSKRQFYSYQAGNTAGGEVTSADAGGADELVFALDVDTVAQPYGSAGDKAFVIAGPVTADLWITSTGTDTELMVQLIDADPATGERLYLQRGVLRASHRAILAERSQCAAFPRGGRIAGRACTDLDNIYRPFRPHVNPQDIVPGQATRYRLEIFPVGHVLRAGHQLLVKVHAPSLDDNDWAYISKTAPALNTLHHSAEHPSRIRLPVIDVADVRRLGGPTSTCSDNQMRCIVAGSDPSEGYRSECHDYASGDPTGIGEALCSGFDALAAALFGGGTGGGEPGPGTAVGAATGEALGAAAGAVQDVIGSAESNGRVQAGAGVVDMTPDVGYGSGQYTDAEPARYGIDPYATGKKQAMSYGVMSRLTGRAVVIEGANGKRIALLKSDNYLAQDHLQRRIAQILAENGSTIGYDQILYGVTHAHSSTYTSTPAAGVWAFQDAFDARQFEFQARRLAEAILLAERNLQPARLGATTVRHTIFKGNIMGPATGDDGTPVQYPTEYGDHGLVVMRIETDEAQPKPIAAWINWGEHPEGLDGYDLHSADFVAFLERYVDRELGAPLVYSQGDVGSSEKSGNDQQRLRDDGTVCEGSGASGPACKAGEGTWRDWNHKGYVQNERNVRFLADAVIKGWKVIGGEQPVDRPASGVLPNNYVPEVQVPVSNRFPVDYRNAFVPGPLSHPYPAVSNCRAEPTYNGDVGAPVLGLPDCARAHDGFGAPGEIDDAAEDGYEQAYQAFRDNGGGQAFGVAAMVAGTLAAEGVPVPQHYDATAFGTVEENARLKLQAFRIGDIVLGSCACEAQVDLILNFESRANDVENDVYDGFDWACVAEDKGLVPADPAHVAACATQRSRYFDVREFPTPVPGSLADGAKVARMRAQVHNDAAGWDAPEYVPYANAEPADPRLIKGNFTREELPADRGYKLAVGVGHAGDYNGYTVSYREFMSHDHYRKALTSYGPHTADYMVTRLVRMAGAMRGAPELAPEPLDTAAQADEARQVAASTALGQAARDAYETYYAALPPDAGSAAALVQPRDIGRFTAATFTWRGGATAIDNPRVVVERCAGAGDAACTGGEWQPFANQTGEVQTRVQWPTADQLPLVYAGQFEWRWTANFEAYEAFPARLGSTPEGVYRFAVEGCINGVDAPDQNIANRVTNFFAGLLPAAVRGDVVAPLQCRGGAQPYALASSGFRVETAAEVVQDVRHDDDGDLVIRVSPTGIPRTYASAFFPYLRDDGGSKYCKECSFRPWATSTAAPSAVTVRAGPRLVQAEGTGADWTAAIGLADGEAAEITVRYADGSFGRPFTYTRSGPANVEAPDDGGSDAPQLCAPGEVPGIGGECLADNGGEDVQDAVDEAYGALTGGL